MLRAACFRTVPLAALFGIVLAATPALARPAGQTNPCGDCHYKKPGPSIVMEFSNENPRAGETVTITVKLSTDIPEAKRTGLWLSTLEQGEFELVEPTTTRYDVVAEGSDKGQLKKYSVVHKEPRVLMGGKASFVYRWKAPSTPGIADFTAWSMVGNGDTASDNDYHSTLGKSIAHGCAGMLLYPDVDKDGFGDKKSGKLSCVAIPGYISDGRDCDDTNAMISPSGTEICNQKDDDCDGVADSGLDPGLYYADPDGDGYASASAAPALACSNTPGVAKEKGDCAPNDKNIHPGAREVQNGKDDNCNGQIDEPDTGPTTDAGTSDKDGGGTPVSPSDASGGCAVAGGGQPLSWTLFLAALALGRWGVRRRQKTGR